MKHIVNYKPKDFAELLNVSVKTLQRWDRQNILKAKRTPTNRRYYTYDQYLDYKGVKEKIDTIYVTHKDRFTRFGFSWFERFLGKFNTKIVVVNNETLSAQEELVQDIISILHVFSCRIYGLRKYKKKIKEDKEIAKSV